MKRKAYGINRVEVAEPLPPLGGWEGNINLKKYLLQTYRTDLLDKINFMTLSRGKLHGLKLQYFLPLSE